MDSVLDIGKTFSYDNSILLVENRNNDKVQNFEIINDIDNENKNLIS